MMLRSLAPFCLLLCVAAGAPPALSARLDAQTQGRATESESRSTAILLGQVVDAETGEAVADAVITLSGRPAPGRARRGGAPPPGGNLVDLLAAARGRGASADRVAADGDGRFVFRDLPPSRYTLRAEAPGYLAGAPGPLGRGAAPATVQVGPDDRSVRATVRLAREAIVTGIVVDEASEPVIRARVVAYRRNISQLGEVTYDQSKTATTDDRGEYRMYGVLPGSYLIAVPQRHETALASGADAMLESFVSGQMPAGGLGGLGRGGSPMDPNAVRIGDWRLSSTNVQSPSTAGDGPLRAYRTVYHPAALSPGTASAVTLRSGEQRSGIDFALAPVLTGRISGVVMGPSGPVDAVPVRAIATGDELPGTSSLSDVASGQTSADGSFTLLAVPPGQYRVVAEREVPDLSELPEELLSNPMVKMALDMQASRAASPLFGEATATVGDGEFVEVAITGSEGITITGQIEFEGEAAGGTDAAGIRVLMRSLDATSTRTRIARAEAGGRFVLEGVLPGRYVVAPNVMQNVAPNSGGAWLVRDVTAGGQNASRSPVEVGYEDLAMTVTLTRDVGALAGTVTRDPSQSTDAAPTTLTAVVVPSNYMTWTTVEMAADKVRVARVGDDGTFRVGPLLAGEYLAAVVDESTVDMSLGLSALQSIASQATRVTVTAGGPTSVTVDVVGGRR